jgi:pimeloyl-ACP methyl ester carboxylesterase
MAPGRTRGIAFHRTNTIAAGLAVTIVEPDGQSNGHVLYCVPGGGFSRRYFDLELPGWSMAAHLAGQGFTVVCIDHPGVGESPAPADPWTLTPAVVADADAAAVGELQQQLGGIAIGVGHSMGGMLTLTAQARHHLYAGVALLGYAHSDDYERSAVGTQLSDDERSVLGDPAAIDARLVSLARQRFPDALFEPGPSGPGASTLLLGGMTVPEDARAAMKLAGSPLLACCGLASMLKCTVEDVRDLAVPTFVAFGEHDIAGNARSTASALAKCRDITLFELAGAGHNHNVAPNRAVLWDRLAWWAAGVS